MKRSPHQLREDALAIWRAGVAAVDSHLLVRENLQIDGDFLLVGDDAFRLRDLRRIVVVGAGKAGAGMAAGVEAALGEYWSAEKQLRGWVNVPADCVRPLQRIHLHPARPAGLNEPTADGVAGTEQILQLVADLTPHDLCLCLLSGGGSALLPAPVEGITLADKQAITRHLSASGANIQELNCVRKQLSRIKGGGLARACRAGRLISLIISDVLGDPLDVIASGPTVPDSGSPADALRILEKYDARRAGVAPAALEFLATRPHVGSPPPSCPVTNLVIGNNAVAVDAAGIEAERRGYAHAMLAARQLEGAAEDVGRHHAELAFHMCREPGPDCLITGGEPIVHLAAADQRGRGGRNQQLVLAALERLLALQGPSAAGSPHTSPLNGIAILSGGTDGEDGPTDAAGAWIDTAIWDAIVLRHGSPAEAIADHLRRNDAYGFFGPLGGLIKTGPTHTNVCDLRVVVTDRRLEPSASLTGRAAPSDR